MIWDDLNQNGIQDSDELGIEGVTIELYNSAEEKLNTTTTDREGKYKFCNLDNGDYSIKVITPNGYSISPLNQGSDDSKDSDINEENGQSK